MAIPKTIQIQHGKLPDNPGVYFYYGKQLANGNQQMGSGDVLLYVGKATSLKKRVGSYFNKNYQKKVDPYSRRIAQMVSEIDRIEYIETPTVIEALVLEANMIRAKKPHYNVLLTDDKSFLYLVITNEPFPKPLFKRGLELAREGIDPFQPTSELSKKNQKRYLGVYGPFTSPNALRNALDLMRRIFPWSTCNPPEATGSKRPCFDAHIRKCPGVCTGAIGKVEYRRNIRELMKFFEGEKVSLIKRLEKQMKVAADKLAFEKAEVLRRRINALKHIRDISVITKDFSPLPYENPDKGFIDALGRVEAYDISNISGTNPVGSMVVFENGKPYKNGYRKFKIKTVEGPNDVAMMREMIERRLKRAENFPKAWKLPDVMVIDGGKPQVNAVQKVLDEMQVRVPIVGLAKGPDRKQDVLIYDHSDTFLARVAHAQKELFQKARDEAHRFAVAYHRNRRRSTVKARRKRKP